jgi:hypothetical protein
MEVEVDVAREWRCSPEGLAQRLEVLVVVGGGDGNDCRRGDQGTAG